jgi:predicted cupin superfamily sugar epimerase
MTAADLVKKYEMLPHPEGGWYKETYRSNEQINGKTLPERFSESRSFSTAIYFLMESGNFSGFHRIKSDECWHFYAGQTLLVYVINSAGNLDIIRLGNNIELGECFQYVVPANCWFASRPANESEFSFVGCTVAPGFDFADFELAIADNLSLAYPQHKSIIDSLCRQ